LIVEIDSVQPKYKNIRLDGNYLKNKLFNTQKVSYLPQHQLLPKNLRVSKVFKLFKVEWKDFLISFDSFKIYANSKIYELSSGELRVIETYLVLNSGKEIILLDEPFSFVAPLYVEKFKFLIQKKSKLINSREDLENEGYVNFSPQQK